MPSDPHIRFSTLKSFYKEQISLSASGDPDQGSLGLAGGYASPSSLARIMSLYSNSNSSSALAAASFLKKSRQKPQPMREALNSSEGLLVSPPFSDPATSPSPIAYSSTLTPAQRLLQHTGMGLGHPSARDVSSLRPIPVLLRTKRSKRCQTCKHILVKPEVKPTSTRYRIRLLASSYIPHVSLRPLPSPSTTSSSKTSLKSISTTPQTTIPPNKPTQFILRLTNPLFDRVKVRLGCPAILPSKPVKSYSRSRRKYRHRPPDRVTILCPQFEIGANSDVWDDALNTTTNPSRASSPAKKGTNSAAAAGIGGEQVAGKLYESGRNWVSVVIEIVAGADTPVPEMTDEEKREEERVRMRMEDLGLVDVGGVGDREDDVEHGELGSSTDAVDDDAVLEIPIRVHLEWLASSVTETGATSTGLKGTVPTKTAGAARLLDEGEGGVPEKGEHGLEEGGELEDPRKRELSYWMVVGVGKVGRVVNEGETEEQESADV